MDDVPTPTTLHLKKSTGLEIAWNGQPPVFLPVRYLRKMCPCATCQGERDLMGRTLLPIVRTSYDGPIVATSAELVGNYALRITWSDQHSTGIYSFKYLHELAEAIKGTGS